MEVLCIYENVVYLTLQDKPLALHKDFCRKSTSTLHLKKWLLIKKQLSDTEGSIMHFPLTMVSQQRLRISTFLALSRCNKNIINYLLE